MIKLKSIVFISYFLYVLLAYRYF